MTFEKLWPMLAIPGEFDAMDELDQARWRGVLRQAFEAGHEAGQAERVVLMRECDDANRARRDCEGDLLRATARIAELEAELERERMRLAACGVVALANTPESAKQARQMHADYRSGSCDEVARSVDAYMKLRDLFAETKERLADALIERDSLMRKWAIESDESLTECVERNIDGWKQRCLRAEAERDALKALLREASINLLSVGYLRGEAKMSLYDRIVAALAAKEE